MRGPSTLLLAAALAACASQPAPAPSPPAMVGGTGTLTVANATGEVIFRVRFGPADGDDWGPDRLDASEVLRSGARRSWPVTGGRYRVLAQLDGGARVAGREEVEVPPGGEGVIRLGEDARDLGALVVLNATPFAVARVYFSLTSQAGWGENRLDAGELLVAGARRTWRVPPGRYNVRIVYQDEVGVSSPTATEVTAGGSGLFRVE